MAHCARASVSARPRAQLTAPRSRKTRSTSCSADGWHSAASQQVALRISSSYARLTSRHLIPGIGHAPTAEEVFNAPVALVAQNGVGGAADAQFNYANKLALDAFEATWDEWMGRPSRLSAPPDNADQNERNELLDVTATSAVVFAPEIVRVSVRGRRFRGFDVQVFNVYDESGAAVGQAAVIPRFVHIDP